MKPGRSRRPARATRGRQCSVLPFLFCLLCALLLTILGGDYFFSLLKSYTANVPNENVFEGSTNSNNETEKSLHFGHESAVDGEEWQAKDSRYWDKDDRRRDRYTDISLASGQQGGGPIRAMGRSAGSSFDQERERAMEMTNESNSKKTGNGLVDDSRDYGSFIKKNPKEANQKVQQAEAGLEREANGGVYNERGRKELRYYEKKFEESLKSEHDPSLAKKSNDSKAATEGKLSSLIVEETGWKLDEDKDVNGDEKASYEYDEEPGNDDYDDAGEEDDYNGNDNENENGSEDESTSRKNKSRNSTEAFGLPFQKADEKDTNVNAAGNFMQDSSLKNNATQKSLHKGMKGNPLAQVKGKDVSRKPRRKGRRRRRTSVPCGMELLNMTSGLKEPKHWSNFTSFSLNYIMKEEKPMGAQNWEPRFAGHQTLEEREDSFKAVEKTLHCGFIQGDNASSSTGFDLDEGDTEFLRSCRIAVSSCIFGNSDHLHSPRGKKLAGSFKKEVCFVMFVDELTLDVMIEEGQGPDEKGYAGLWKVVVVKNLPYMDGRRVGKIPKFLSHRLFPAAWYSIWLDSKLRLQIDPVLILEYFLWRGGHEYAISNHYQRHCVWQEVQQNKRLNKYNHTVIDEQFEFYQRDGLTKFNASDPNKLLPSNVPEGSFIVRAHTPMSNLFSCLWFNEVDRFTPRDQLSFAYTYMKFVRTNQYKLFRLNMFKDCERREVAKLFRHRITNTENLQKQ